MSLEAVSRRLDAMLRRLKGEPALPKRATPKEKLAKLLEALGFDCDARDISHAKGYWTHAHQDCLDRWTANCYKDGKPVEITGTSNVTECARFGIIVEPNGLNSDVYGDYQCTAKPKPKKL